MNTQARLAAVLAATLLSTAVPAASTVGAAAAAPGGYIVVLREGSETDLIAREHAARYGFEIQHLYHAALNGYAGWLDSAVAERLSGDARVGLRLA